ncbi:MAG: hypothetical protein R6X34_26320, partial [Chloroflexota bacterium]
MKVFIDGRLDCKRFSGGSQLICGGNGRFLPQFPFQLTVHTSSVCTRFEILCYTLKMDEQNKQLVP